MRTSAVVALWWNRGLLNHTVEPPKSLSVGSALPSDQTALTTFHKCKVLAGGEQKWRGQSESVIFDAEKLPSYRGERLWLKTAENRVDPNKDL